jgi:hypothetical protein
MKTLVAALCLLSVPAFADTTWKGNWKTTAGTCRDGNDVTITETPTLLKYESNPATGRQYQEVPLSSDGSGKLEWKAGTMGTLLMQVPAGRGKRFITLQQTGGCRWVLQ